MCIRRKASTSSSDLFELRVRFAGRQRQFFAVPERYDINSGSDLVVNSVIAWSFYPKLLAREGKGWRNVANNQAVSLHPTSVNKGSDAPIKWLSFYHIMQARNKFYNAHETSAVEDFAVALLCGDPEFKVRYICKCFPLVSFFLFVVVARGQTSADL